MSTTEVPRRASTAPPTEREEGYAAALALLADRPLVVLTGAGLSTDSGIPDYRGPGRARGPVGSRATRPRGVMTYQEFVGSASARQRYWARSHLGWVRMQRAEPNPGHHALAGTPGVELLITQNVDGLHERAGQARLVALHGRIADVVCLGCGDRTVRAALQRRLTRDNPGFAERHAQVAARPDGDVALEHTDDFRVPPCEHCGGTLKPDVVFFGENVPAPRVQRCYAAVDRLRDTGGALLVVGSSLTVMSGLRFVKRAAGHDIPVVTANRGATRGDPLAAYRLETGCSDFLAALAERRTQMR